MASNLLESIRLLANSSRVMADKMVDGIGAERGARVPTSPRPRRRS